MICFRMSSTSLCCDGASVAFFLLPWQVHLVAISVGQNFALEALSFCEPQSLFLGFLVSQNVTSSAWNPVILSFIACLLAVFSTGGHVCLEQPSSAFSWQDPSVQDILAETAAVCSVVPACCFGLNIHKKWLFASSLQDMSQLAGECNRASWEHENLVGKRDEWGGFRTQQSAVYPDGLCETIVQIIRPLFPRCEPPLDVSVTYLGDCVPKKGASDPPHSFQDRAGIHSVPDWSVPPATAKPLPVNLRQSLLQWLSERRIQKHVQSCEDSPLFTTDEVEELRTIFAAWFQSSFGITSVDWSVPPGQPYCLHALQCLSECLRDRDRSLWHCLLHGVPTGFDGDIPPSNVFLPALPTDDRSELAVCFGNWKGAEDSPALLQSLVQEEIDKGYFGGDRFSNAGGIVWLSDA